MTDGINTVKDGAILEITIDRPKANAIDLAASRRRDLAIERVRCRCGAPACRGTINLA